MKIKCDYCGSFINDFDEKCPNCGAVNSHLVRNANQAPKTIEELKQWYIDRKLPDENTTRFFIGKDYKGARAFGIYKDEASENFVVYKNKADGSRAVRYEGKDEAYAVNEIYMKLKEEIVNQKARNNTVNNQARPVKRKTKFRLSKFIIFFYIFMALVLHGIFNSGPNRGYYHYGDNYYYYQSGSWFGYNDYDGWYSTDVPDDLEDNYSDYYDSSRYSSNYDIDSFEDSNYYVEPSSSSSSSSWDSSSSSWDSSSDWDSGSSWDSSSSDWDSDW